MHRLNLFWENVSSIQGHWRMKFVLLRVDIADDVAISSLAIDVQTVYKDFTKYTLPLSML